MGFLRRLLGGGEAKGTETNADAHEGAADTGVADVDGDAAEREHELDLMRGEQERFDELTQRQLRYADYAWQPPAQGGERRADDEDGTTGR
jgi:hypothetical protein